MPNMKTETDVGKRWEKGIPHHPESLALFRQIAAVDFKLMDDYFCWKSGGDGDNGESLMYLMDIVFDARDNGESEELSRLVGLR